MQPMNELAVFAAVVEAGSFSGAARALGMSKAAVSDQVRRLETRFGAQLLKRTTRRIALTDAGRACFGHASRMVGESEAAARAALLFQEQPRGKLRIAAPTTFAPLYIAPILPEFLAEHPRLAVELAVSSSWVDVLDERFDVAVRIGELPDSRLVARRIAVAHLVVCASPAYLQERGMPLTLEDLRSHDTLEFSPLEWRGTWRLVGPNRRPRNVSIEPVFSSDAGEALLAAASAGLGLAALPNWMVAPALQSGELVQVLPGWSTRPVPINAVHASSRATPAKIRLFVDFLAGKLAERAWSAARPSAIGSPAD